MTIREEVSKILGYRVPQGKWVETLEEMWPSGRPGNKEMKQIVFMLCRRIEELENGRTNNAI